MSQSIEPGVKRRTVLEFFDVLNKFICTKVVKRGPTLKIYCPYPSRLRSLTI